MGLLQTIALAAMNAVTALLPIGSSGHRSVIPEVLGWAPMAPAAMLAVYGGMLIAVASYFWRDVGALLSGAGKLMRGRADPGARLLVFLIVATIPTAAGGLAMRHLGWTQGLGPAAVAAASIGFGFLLLVSDRLGVTVRKLSHFTWPSTLIIGSAQVLAVLPGAGRSGLDVTLARILGYERTEATRISALLSLPLLTGAIVLTALDAAHLGALTLTADAVIAGVTAFCAAFVAIAALMAWLDEHTFAVFAIYRIAAGAALLGWMYFA